MKSVCVVVGVNEEVPLEEVPLEEVPLEEVPLEEKEKQFTFRLL